ncbi:MAG: 3'-5' exonuclease [Candidatus Pacebacteria bacterium]|nr:3'-5' exonuclease [Candidatus Paceibacterota bacterium]
MYLFFDTETTGLPKSFKAPVSDLDNWPRLVQLAWQNYDAQGNLLASFNYIIKPNGFIISDEVAKIHRITQARAEAEGVELEPVLTEFVEHLNKNEFAVAHNFSFDENIVGSELLRAKMENIFERIRKICTMKGTVNVCQIPGARGYKWPNLTELHKYLFQKDFAEAHDAEADVKALANCFFGLKRRGLIF